MQESRPQISVRLATSADLDRLADHHFRHTSESGRGGDVVFTPFAQAYRKAASELERERSPSWAKSVNEPGWGRCWILTDSDEIVGTLELTHRPPLETALHRALLMIGLERAYRGQGWGSKLMSHALSWARQQPTLEWIQLQVFAHNKPAQNLYRKFGFEEAGVRPDLFRVRGPSIDDLAMLLRLR